MKKLKDGPIAIDIETSNGVDTDEVIMIQRADKPAVRLDDMAGEDIAALTSTGKAKKNFAFDVPTPFYPDTQILGRISRKHVEPSIVMKAINVDAMMAQSPEAIREKKEELLDVRKDEDDCSI